MRFFAAQARRMFPVAARWIITLAAVYLAVRRSGAYGLVTDAQNLIAIFGVLRVAAYAIEAQHAIRRGDFTRLFRIGPIKIPRKRERRAGSGASGKFGNRVSDVIQSTSLLPANHGDLPVISFWAK